MTDGGEGTCGYKQTSETKEKIKKVKLETDRVWVKKEEKSTLINKNLLNSYIENGWCTGRYFSNETRNKLSKKAKDRNYNPMLGKHHNLETRNKIASSNSKKTLGENNNAKSILIFGILFSSTKEAMIYFNLPRDICYKIGIIQTNSASSIISTQNAAILISGSATNAA